MAVTAVVIGVKRKPVLNCPPANGARYQPPVVSPLNQSWEDTKLQDFISSLQGCLVYFYELCLCVTAALFSPENYRVTPGPFQYHEELGSQTPNFLYTQQKRGRRGKNFSCFLPT